MSASRQAPARTRTIIRRGGDSEDPSKLQVILMVPGQRAWQEACGTHVSPGRLRDSCKGCAPGACRQFLSEKSLSEGLSDFKAEELPERRFQGPVARQGEDVVHPETIP